MHPLQSTWLSCLQNDMPFSDNRVKQNNYLFIGQYVVYSNSSNIRSNVFSMLLAVNLND